MNASAPNSEFTQSHAERTRFFLSIANTILVFIAFYAAVYWCLGARFISLWLAIGVIFCHPLVVFLEKRHCFRASRLSLLGFSSYYILSSCVGVRQPTEAEFYFLPAVMAPFLLFSSQQKRMLLVSMVFPLVGWIIAKKMDVVELSVYWIPTEFPYRTFKALNYLGSFSITVIFLWFYNESVNRIKEVALYQERRRLLLEADKVRSDKLLEHTSRLSALGQMAAGIAHEINNPITIIKGKASQLQRLVQSTSLEPSLQTEFSRGLEKIIGTSDRVAKIVKGLRTLSRNADEDPFDVVSLPTIIDETLALCRERFRNAGVEIRYWPPREDYQVVGSSSQLGQVLLNLVSNAFDAVAESEERWIRVTCTAQGANIKVAVLDSGPGIADDVLSRMATPFFTTKEVGKGTGLGLSISRAIVEKHHGRLNYAVVEAHTCFEVEIPRAYEIGKMNRDSQAA